jgi:general secretion pathway protein F
MPVFEYVALDSLGRSSSGTAQSENEATLKASLRRDGLFLVQADLYESEGDATEIALDQRSLPPQVLCDLTERLEILTKGGIPLVETLRQLARDEAHPRAKAVLTDLAAFVASGRPLGEALERHPRVFDEAYRAAIAAGEHAGALDKVLETLSKKLAFGYETKRQIRGALAYPAGLLVALLGLMALVTLVLVPKMSEVFVKARVSPPGITLAMMAAKDFLVLRWQWVLLSVVVGVVAFTQGMRITSFRRGVQAFLYRLPIIGDLLRMAETSAFVGVVGLLHAYGVNLPKALDIAARAVRTERMKDAVRLALASVARGEGLAESLRSTDAFPPLVIQMTEVGQKSGSLEEAFGRVEGFLTREIPRRSRKLVGLLGPIITILAGATVGVAVYSVLAPLMSVMQALKGGGR